jgi:hypothetical protein
VGYWCWSSVVGVGSSSECCLAAPGASWRWCTTACCGEPSVVPVRMSHLKASCQFMSLLLTALLLVLQRVPGGGGMGRVAACMSSSTLILGYRQAPRCHINQSPPFMWLECQVLGTDRGQCGNQHMLFSSLQKRWAVRLLQPMMPPAVGP